MKRTNLHLTELELRGLKDLSFKTGLTVAELIRRAVDKFIEVEKDK